jgi:hypothetical protein
MGHPDMTYPPATPPDQPWQPTPSAAPQKSKMGLFGIIVGVVALLAIGVAVAVIGHPADDTNSAASTPTTESDGYITAPPHTSAAPTTPSGATYNMRTGEGVRVSFDDGTQWVVKLVGTHWYPAACNGYSGTDPVLVVDLEFSADSGTGSLNTLFELKFVDSDGIESISTGFTGCVHQKLDSLNVPAGQKRSGQLDFVVKSGKGGLLEYEDAASRHELTGPGATWVIDGPAL